MNTDYYRELANFEFARRALRPVSLLVVNVGRAAASNVRCELEIKKGGVVVYQHSKLPVCPKQEWDPASGIRPSLLEGRHHLGEVRVQENEERYRVVFECEELQPGRHVWSDAFYVGTGETALLRLIGKVFASNLPMPKDFALTITVNVTKSRMTLPELKELPEPTQEIWVTKS